MDTDTDLAIQYEWNQSRRAHGRPETRAPPTKTEQKSLKNLDKMLLNYGISIDEGKLFNMLVGNWIHESHQM